MTILAAIDETERAKEIVPLAYDLATAYGDELIVLHVVPTEDYEEHKEDLERALFRRFNSGVLAAVLRILF